MAPFVPARKQRGRREKGRVMPEPSGAWQTLNTRQVRTTVVTFAAGVFLVALAGIALACVPWKGQMTVDTPGQDVTVHGDDTSSMVWCPGESYAPATANQGDSIGISVDKTTKCGTNKNQLANGDYDVTLSNPGGFVDDNGDGEYTSDEWYRDCMYPVGLYSHHLGTMKVKNGQGSGTYSIPSDGTVVDSLQGEATGVCVTDQSQNQGNMAPLTIL